MPINYIKYLLLFGLTLIIIACNDNSTLINDTQTPNPSVVQDIQPKILEYEKKISDIKDDEDNKSVSSNKTEQLIQVNSQKFTFNGSVSLQEIKRDFAEDQFTIYTFDVNADGIDDLVISRINDAKNFFQGDELYILIGDKSGKYKLSLSTSNHTDDGGFFLSNIIPRSNSKGFILSTYFSSRGYPFKDYYFIENNNQWQIKEVIIKGYLGEDQFYCHHPQSYVVNSSSSALSEDSMSDEEISKECPYPSTKFRVKADTAEILDENFKSRFPPNYYIKGDAIETFDQNEDWVKVSYKNGTKFGWIDKRNLKSIPN